MVGSDEERALIALRSLILAVERYRQSAADYYGLNVTDSQAISHLVEKDLGSTELAARLNITTGAATALVDRLERADLAHRHADPNDRRRSAIRLSDTGRKLIAESRTWASQMFDDIPPDELGYVATLLEKLSSKMMQQAEEIVPRLKTFDTAGRDSQAGAMANGSANKG